MANANSLKPFITISALYKGWCCPKTEGQSYENGLFSVMYKHRRLASINKTVQFTIQIYY